MKSRNTKVAAVVAALAIFGGACGTAEKVADKAEEATDKATEAVDAVEEAGDEAKDLVEEAGDKTEEAAKDVADKAEEAVDSVMGDAGSVTMAKADWTTEDPNAYVAKAILEELGYTVSDPAALELGPSNAYLAMAQGDADVWVNSWYPAHNSWLKNDMPEGGTVGDKVSPVGMMMGAGGLQGFLVTKSFAEKHNLKTLDDLNNNPDALAEYDAVDPKPGNGKADIYGCQESYTCDDIIQQQIEFAGWENIQQTIAGYDAMFADAKAKVDEDKPAVIYTWTPSAYITQLIPGDNVVWLGMEKVLDDSNPLGVEGGAEHDQRPGTASIGPDQCPASEGGVCQLGWQAADVQATANNEWLEANPVAKAFLEQFEMSVLDVSLMNVEMADGAKPADLAKTWIEENRSTVDEWITAAKAAG